MEDSWKTLYTQKMDHCLVLKALLLRQTFSPPSTPTLSGSIATNLKLFAYQRISAISQTSLKSTVDSSHQILRELSPISISLPRG